MFANSNIQAISRHFVAYIYFLCMGYIFLLLCMSHKFLFIFLIGQFGQCIVATLDLDFLPLAQGFLLFEFLNILLTWLNYFNKICFLPQCTAPDVTPQRMQA